ncbi:helix-turn-helix domain-containing protein [bacterium]|nr:helix-turn-helix domain-containing protein [bacterium]
MPNTEAVVICTEATTHYCMTHRCLAAGKHVLIEKPMTTTVIDAQKLIELAESKKVILMVGHTFLYNAGIRKVKDYIADNYTETISLDELSTLSGLSPFYLLRVFRKETGLPPYEFLINVRIERAKRLLIRRIPIAVVAHSTGFADQSHFTRFFKRLTGVTPGQYLS